MLFGELIDVVEANAVPVGLIIGLAIGLYSYIRSKNQKEAEAGSFASDPDVMVCPHCQTPFTAAGDACCPDCRRPLDE